MATRTPPIPEANRNPHDGGTHKDGAPTDGAEEAKVTGHDKTQRNLKEQGHQGNIAQNIRHHAHLQDR